MKQTPVFRVNVVSRAVEAINYSHRGSTKIDFRGTSLMPDAHGHAKIESKAGRIEIQANFKNLRDASSYGPEYLTYVLWAVTPEGRPVNLGEIIPNVRGEVSTRVTVNLQAFGMLVTAEPYFAVTRPSNMTVLENVIRRDTRGWEQPISARYDATEKGEYTVDIPSNQFPAAQLSPEERERTPLTLLEARDGGATAKATGAQQYAAEVLGRSEQYLDRANSYYQQDQSAVAIGTAARGAAQAAEDARILSIRKAEDARIAARQKAAEERTRQAQEQASLQQERAEHAREQAMTAEQAQQQAEQSAQQAQQQRQAAEQAKAAALEAQQQAETARQAALEQQQALAAQAQAAQQQAQTAEQRAQAAEQEKEQIRQRLRAQLNQVLETQDTARGLIVNMNDVLFDVNRATLKPEAKLRLARVAGILEAYPGLKLQIEGYTDSTGSLEHNQILSDERADAVRGFLISQGVSPDSISAQGFGPSNPVASNETREGRQLNRRVDLVVNGESIAAQAGQTPAVNPSLPPASMSEPAAPGAQPQQLIDLGQQPTNGTYQLAVPPGTWYSAVYATNSAGLTTKVSIWTENSALPTGG